MRSILLAVPDQYRVLFVCAALTGARQGELLGLQWKHIDLVKRTLRIEQSLWQGQLVSPKTRGSVRTILFGQTLADAFSEHHRQSTEHSPNNFVFCKEDGSPLHPDVVRREVLYSALDRLNIPRPPRTSGFHAFRHAVASFINAQTANLKLAQKLLGHATLSMTADVYTHTSEEAERQATLAVERAIYGDLFPKLFPSGNNCSGVAVN